MKANYEIALEDDYFQLQTPRKEKDCICMSPA